MTAEPVIHPLAQKMPSMADLRPMLEPYTRSDLRRSILQLATTLLPFFLLWYLMWRSLSISYALTLVLAIPAVALYVRIFIFFHDCGHNSFFPSTKANKIVGFWLGVLLFFPSEQWWHAHAIHHATNGNLDRRGVGDVTTWTVQEYLRAPWWKRAAYRVFRNPIIMLVFGPFVMFILANRFPIPRFGRKETQSVIYTNLAIAALLLGLCLLIGWQAYLMVTLPIIWLGGSVGIWLFYLQHQYEDMYWVPTSEWDYVLAGLRGASYYKLPRILQWVTGNIGFHHIHHLNPRIPNYKLEKCFKANPTLQTIVETITLRDSYQNFFLKFWDEETRSLIGFSQLRQKIKA